MKITLKDALIKGIKAHRAGNLQEADQFYTAVLDAQPNHPDANHNLGVLAVSLNKVEEALPYFRRAIDSNSDIEQFWLSYIDALLKLERFYDAKKIFDESKQNITKGDGLNKLKKSLTIVKDPPKKDLQNLIKYYKQGQFHKVLNDVSLLIKKFPNSFSLYNISGVSHKALRNFDHATNAFGRALLFKPNEATVYYNLGTVLKEQGKLQESVDLNKKAISIKPDFAVAYYNMGNALYEQNKIDKGISAYHKAISINPNFSAAFYNLGKMLINYKFKKHEKNFHQTIISLLDYKIYISPRSIFVAVMSLLRYEKKLENLLKKQSNNFNISSLKNEITYLSTLPLLLKFMGLTAIYDLEFEILFTNLRRELLLNNFKLKNSQEVLLFQSALALHCFTNEYIYNKKDKEIKALKKLEDSVEEILACEKQPNPNAILCLASYKALNEYEWCYKLKINSHIKEVFSRQVIEPNYEKNLKNEIHVFEEITDNISLKVRNQYEKNPYPRWVNTGLKLNSSSISTVVNDLNLKLYDDVINKVEEPYILIAGCGTGQHSLYTNSRFKNSKVLAIDLSLSSLAYAKRKSEELNFPDVEYMQADILDLGKLNKKFDIIESVGVLHHMDNPLDGWRVLTSCLKKGGLIRLGLYSELGRQDIVKFQNEIRVSNINLSDNTIKYYRNFLLESKHEHHNQIKRRGDFYSMSELRDLLFNVKEHRFSISQIRNILFDLDLKFCGFESDKSVDNFMLNNSDPEDLYNLNKWDSYEKNNPDTFISMYQFWCQKIS